MKKARTLTVCAMCLAVAVLLSFIRPLEMPLGGSVTLMSMLFVALPGYFFGLGVGLLSAATYGIIQFVVYPQMMTPWSALLDYLVAFGLLGLSGLFWKMKYGLLIGYLVGITGRFAASFVSGILFYYMFTPEGWNVYLYSAAYNGAYIGLEGLVTAIIIGIPAVRSAIERIRAQAAAQ